jgi:hypothetical protein
MNSGSAQSSRIDGYMAATFADYISPRYFPLADGPRDGECMWKQHTRLCIRLYICGNVWARRWSALRKYIQYAAFELSCNVRLLYVRIIGFVLPLFDEPSYSHRRFRWNQNGERASVAIRWFQLGEVDRRNRPRLFALFLRIVIIMHFEQ